MKNNKTLRVAVFGSTTMGTALSHLIASAGHTCTLLTQDATVQESINTQHCHPTYFKGAPIHPAVRASMNIADEIPKADLVVMAVPSHAMRAAAQQLGALIHPAQSVLSSTKGFEPTNTKLMTHVLREECQTEHLGTISGPNMQAYMVKGLPTTLVIASDSAQMRQHGWQAFTSPTINVNTVADLASYEYLSGLKNIVGMEVGMVQGLGLGTNFQGLVAAEGMKELDQLLTKMGLDSKPLYGVAGIADIFLVCTSEFALNYQIAVQMGQGMTLEEALAPIKARGEMAEGVESLRVGLELANQYEQPMPLLEAAHALAFSTRPVSKEEFIEAAFKRNTAGH
ncbi:NAD(P)H-dependent glycerol-3-phosphate dehydrogenase [Thiothrix fructosivorans]|uniref:Glycerol-3-phosphate dehydrogenase n=1 Tax=Thiothrix fructosivorans TaxID=111770 RepID=A0A8B0SGU0_9GAMM|nr:2-dehydropantoate 2-reductase N-terminal domain-containing protein [Thiothrix fructosivorans]MBO0615234.1 hypothetical protein [Thiothrix fructosivorans]QTX10019.1 hypothetical protein J1836_015640 [Thiothrix fructosivorans]